MQLLRAGYPDGDGSSAFLGLCLTWLWLLDFAVPLNGLMFFEVLKPDRVLLIGRFMPMINTARRYG